MDNPSSNNRRSTPGWTVVLTAIIAAPFIGYALIVGAQAFLEQMRGDDLGSTSLFPFLVIWGPLGLAAFLVARNTYIKYKNNDTEVIISSPNTIKPAINRTYIQENLDMLNYIRSPLSVIGIILMIISGIIFVEYTPAWWGVLAGCLLTLGAICTFKASITYKLLYALCLLGTMIGIFIVGYLIAFQLTFTF